MVKQKYFQSLVEDVAACRACPRMANSARILSNAAGTLSAKIMFVGEAPGRLGADQTQIPFHGDTAGHNFEGFLEFAGLMREEIFVTNSVLCNPRDDRGNNATPLPSEVQNCGSFLRRQIELVNPQIVVTLGATSLKAISTVEAHQLTLKDNVRSAVSWFGRLLIPLYHPGQRAMLHRSQANQRSDYQFVAETFRKLSAPRSRNSSATREDVLAMCRYLLRRRGEISYFELHKLAYLAEYIHVKTTGERLTRGFFIRQKDGPYCVDISLPKLKKADASVAVTSVNGKLFVRLNPRDGAGLFDAQQDERIDDKARHTLDEVISRYRYPSDSDLKRAVYLTGPMRMMLRREKYDGVNMYNAPIDFLAA